MKPRICEAIIVEGKYDKNTVAQAVDATIIETEGFGVFSDAEKIALIRRLANKCGIVIFTDGDGAGFVIRNHLKGALKQENIKHAYIPDIYGKERRKRTASKEGKLGVEGMEKAVIIDCLKKAGATFLDDETTQKNYGERITKADMYELGLSGKSDSTERRAALKAAIGLPERISSNALLDVLNALYSREEILKFIF